MFFLSLDKLLESRYSGARVMRCGDASGGMETLFQCQFQCVSSWALCVEYGTASVAICAGS